MKRISSEHFEHAVNQVLLSDTVTDAVKKNIITPEESKPRPPLTVKSITAIFAPGCTYTRPIDILDTSVADLESDEIALQAAGKGI